MSIVPVAVVTHRDVGGEAGDERGGDGVGDGGVRTLGLLSRRSDDVESNKGVEAGGRSLHHLEPNRSRRLIKADGAIYGLHLPDSCPLLFAL